MNSRMDKYTNDTPELRKRTDRNANLYDSVGIDNYDKFDINSNVSVLKNDARSVDVDQIREMLDKKYRENLPKRKSIAIEIDETEKHPIDEKEDTKEYDINSILNKAKLSKNINYEKERLKNLNTNEKEIIEEINKKYSGNNHKEKEEEDLLNLINTITQLEMKNREENSDLLGLQDNDDNNPKEPAVEEKENTFYTGKLVVNQDDYEDFKDMQNDIKSNSVLIKILIIIFVLIVLAVGIVLVNKYLNLGLF